MSGYKNIVKGETVSLETLIKYKKNQVISLNICESESIRIVLFSFSLNEAITEEQTQNTEQFTVIDGEMEFIVNDKKFIMKENDTIIINPDDTHSLLALKPSKMLQTSYK